MLEYEFMRNALLAILIMTPLFGLVGTVIVNNKMAFFSDALGHSALTGIAIGAIFGITNPTISMIIFGIVFMKHELVIHRLVGAGIIIIANLLLAFNKGKFRFNKYCR